MKAKICPNCGGKLVHDVGRIGGRGLVGGWRCEHSFATARNPNPVCEYWEEDSGESPDLEEAILRAESRQDIKHLKAYEEINELFA